MTYFLHTGGIKNVKRVAWSQRKMIKCGARSSQPPISTCIFSLLLCICYGTSWGNFIFSYINWRHFHLWWSFSLILMTCVFDQLVILWRENGCWSLWTYCVYRPITLGKGTSLCIGDLDLCTNGLTITFWFKLNDPDRHADVQRLFYSADVSVTASSNIITAAFLTTQLTLSVEFNVTFQQWHHASFTWAVGSGLMALVDFVRTFRGIQSSSLKPSAENAPMIIGEGVSNIAASMSHLVVYEVVMSISELQKVGKCNDFVSGKRLRCFYMFQLKLVNFSKIIPTRNTTIVFSFCFAF